MKELIDILHFGESEFNYDASTGRRLWLVTRHVDGKAIVPYEWPVHIVIYPFNFL